MRDTGNILYLSRSDVARAGLGMAEIIDIVEQVFREKAKGNVEMPPKPGIHPVPESFIHAMPAYVPTLGAAAIKWVSGYPQNPGRGLPYIAGMVILNDPETGLPLAVMDASWITAMRTAAASAVAAKHLARPDPKTLAVIGCGVQGRSHIAAMTTVFPSIDRVKAYDISPENLSNYIAEMAGRYPRINFDSCDSPREAVGDTDIIVTAGPIKKTPEPGIERGWVKPGVFASPVDFDTYWHRDALREFDKIITDDVAQFHYYRQQGYFGEFPELHADLSNIVSSTHPGRTSPNERIMSMHLGLAVEDASVARRLFEIAVESNIGQWLER
ncbi:MAG: ornithine cyclodeaminase family protein [Candidatus Hydrogenedentota bacterium]|nr:MAG: ornithine cyclodeaminase family protein [Candidatus Hydrogenedentota bacterium]